MKEKHNGYWYCKKCDLRFKVVTLSHNQGYVYPRKIKECPHCQNKEIESISKESFDKINQRVWINVYRGKVQYSLKFGVEDE